MAADYRWMPLNVACYSDKNLGTIQLLLNAGADVNGGGGDNTPLHQAVLGKNTQAIELLIEAGADVNRVSTGYVYPLGSTLLHLAASRDKLDCIHTLLAAGVDPSIADARGRTPLHVAAWNSYVEIVVAFLDAGADPLHRDNDGRTPLQYLHQIRRYAAFSAQCFNTITALVAAGDRSWECVPTPCHGLQAAMFSVWQAAPDEFPELVKRLENPAQSVIELFPRMDDEEMKKVVQEVLRGLHRHFAGFPHVKEQIMKSIFDFTSV